MLWWVGDRENCEISYNTTRAAFRTFQARANASPAPAAGKCMHAEIEHQMSADWFVVKAPAPVLEHFERGGCIHARTERETSADFCRESTRAGFRTFRTRRMYTRTH
jgi:hypothetical protein